MTMRHFEAHGFCFFWDPQILVLLVSGDAIIAISYFAIAWCLERARTRLSTMFENKWLADINLRNFRNFIALCGCTHLMHILVIWEPWYLAQGIVNFVTASVSLATAFTCLKLVDFFMKAKRNGEGQIPRDPPAPVQ